MSRAFPTLIPWTPYPSEAGAIDLPHPNPAEDDPFIQAITHHAPRFARRSHHLTAGLLIAFHLAAPAHAHPDPDPLLAETYPDSIKQREQALRKTIARDTGWPDGVWGETLWTLAALRLNEKTDDANARLLKRARDDIALNRKGQAYTAFFREWPRSRAGAGVSRGAPLRHPQPRPRTTRISRTGGRPPHRPSL